MSYRKWIASFAALFGAVSLSAAAFAGGVYVNSPSAYARNNGYASPYYSGYANPYYYNNNPSVVVIQQNQPLIVPRYGSNDALYTYDNIYGPEASAAGRMSYSVHNPQPFYNVYYPR